MQEGKASKINEKQTKSNDEEWKSMCAVLVIVDPYSTRTRKYSSYFDTFSFSCVPAHEESAYSSWAVHTKNHDDEEL